jgi:hypothetical protein
MRGTGAEKCSANVANVLFLSFFFLGSLTTFAVCVCREMFSENCSFFSSLQVKRQRKGGEKRGRPGGSCPLIVNSSRLPGADKPTDRQPTSTDERERESAMRLFWQIIVLSAVLLEAGESRSIDIFFLFHLRRFLNERDRVSGFTVVTELKRKKGFRNMNGDDGA